MSYFLLLLEYIFRLVLLLVLKSNFSNVMVLLLEYNIFVLFPPLPITNQPWLSCHTCTSFTHPHISSTLPYTRCKVLFLPWLTFLSVHQSLWLLLLCLTPDCLTLELWTWTWTCACDLDLCLVLFTSLLCLWYSCYCPLTIACFDSV